MGDSKMMTTKEVMKFFKCSEAAIRKYKREGFIESNKKDGRKDLWDVHHIISMKDIINTLKSKGKTLRQIKEEIDLLKEERIDTDDIRILLIEDEEGCRGLFRQCFDYAVSKKPLRIQDAEDGLMGVEYAKRLKPHIIILDLGLPKLTGMDVYEELKDHPSTCNSKFVFVSGNVYDYRPEGTDFIGKPFKLAEIIDKFGALIKNVGK